MIITFYGESTNPTGAADAAHRQFDEWQHDHDDIEILQIATAGCSFGDRFGFWLTVHWRWNEDPQRWSGGGDLSALVALDQIEHSRALLDAQSDTYEGSKARR